MMIKTLLFLILLIFLTFDNSLARVVGRCSNCHTMHNSQNGSAVASGGPYETLLVNSCLGCHSATGGAVWKDPVTGAPIVYNIDSAPIYGGGQGLAGGNFYWVKTDDTKGHNIFSQDSNLSIAPGDMGYSVCGTNACHANLYGVSVPPGGWPEIEGRQGCTKCHMITEPTEPPGYGKVKGFHHANDGTGTKYVDSADKGWYRFLGGHMAGYDSGVTGIEHVSWNYGATTASHNEYAGMHHIGGGEGFLVLPKTMTGYCTGCHGVFHDDQRSGSMWIRHPSDAVIPNSGEYGSINTTYNPNVPVARPIDTFDWAGGPSGTVAAGTDLVMCLSCHRSHGSPYPDMLRWDYSTMIAGGGGSGGCFTCHTQKNQTP
jgi:predicted CXXCH cytochrome family protein